jgi:G:T-mismatch repair DNA endonuclease (very short patch repair protein)
MRSQSTIEKLRQSAICLWQNPQYREKLRQSHLGHKPTNETKRKMSEAHKQRYTSPEVSRIHKEILNSPQTKAKQKSAAKLRCNTEEYKKQFAERMNHHYQNPEYRTKMQQIAKTCHKTNEARENAKLSSLIRFSSPDSRKQLSIAHIGIKPTLHTKQKMSNAQTKRFSIPSERKRQSKRLKQAYKSPVLRQMAKERMCKVLKVIPQEKRDIWIKHVMLANNIKPNKPELFLIQLLNTTSPNEWKYVGDGKVIICGRSPDFININGKKSVILLHGVYWHLLKKRKDNPDLTKEQVEQEDINFYKTYGWDCLIIWENELKNPEKVLTRIKQFTM